MSPGLELVRGESGIKTFIRNSVAEKIYLNWGNLIQALNSTCQKHYLWFMLIHDYFIQGKSSPAVFFLLFTGI